MGEGGAKDYVWPMHIMSVNPEVPLKEELHSRFNLSLEERVKIFKHIMTVMTL